MSRAIESHPVWVRGLKRTFGKTQKPWRKRVAPRVGAWIETLLYPCLWSGARVAPRVGAWIETSGQREKNLFLQRRTPCGCVD